MGLNPSYALSLLAMCWISSAANADIQSHAQQLNSDISTIEAGIICPPPTIGTVAAPDTVAGTTHVIEVEPSFVSNAQTVPAVLGIGFGVKTQTSQPGGLAGVTMVVTHPAMGPNATTTQSFTTSISDESTSLSFYQFDYSYELLLGSWEMTALLDETVLYRVGFEVVSPDAVPELADVCGYLDLLS